MPSESAYFKGVPVSFGGFASSFASVVSVWQWQGYDWVSSPILVRSLSWWECHAACRYGRREALDVQRSAPDARRVLPHVRCRVKAVSRVSVRNRSRRWNIRCRERYEVDEVHQCVDLVQVESRIRRRRNASAGRTVTDGGLAATLVGPRGWQNGDLAGPCSLIFSAVSPAQFAPVTSSRLLPPSLRCVLSGLLAPWRQRDERQAEALNASSIRWCGTWGFSLCMVYCRFVVDKLGRDNGVKLQV